MGPIPSVSERRIPKMLSAWHGRMDRHIRLNVERGTFPVVVVAGKIANAALAQLPIGEPLATIDVCGFLIPRCLSFVALLHIPHPSSHLHDANALVPRALFRSAFQLAGALQLNPHATDDELMARVDASVRTQHDANARVIRELNLPGCSGS